NEMIMIKQFLCKLFSDQCQLISFRLDISNESRDGSIHRCLSSSFYIFSNLISYQHQSYCVTLRYLYIRINQIRFLEDLIEHVPNLEKLSVELDCSLGSFASWRKSNVEILKQSKTNWFNKIQKLKYFSLKTFIYEDYEFIYLKWLLNNLNYIEKLQLHIKHDILNERICHNIMKSLIDANFIRQYCLPDLIPNLIYFNFYIYWKCQLSFNDIEIIKNSFKIHPFFISYQWTDVTCLFDPIIECQHLFSSFNNTVQSYNSFINYSYIFNWPPLYNIWYNLYPSLYLFLERFNDYYRHVSCIKVYKNSIQDFNKTDLLMSLEILSNMKENNRIDGLFRNVTKIQFGTYFDRRNRYNHLAIDQNEIRAKILAYLISMTVQLKYLLVERFEWLLHIVQYTSDKLIINTLNTVQYAEFCLSSCHYGCSEQVRIGKNLVPFLSTYMPHLQTLHLWRPGDFPWTSTKINIILLFAF
ncbi:unnamed protein product, partial [Rotaria sordida]